MKTRVITALCALCVLVPYLVFSDTFMLEIFVSVLATVAVSEMLGCAGLDKKWRISVPSYIVSFIIPWSVRHIDTVAPLFPFLGGVFFVYLFYLLAAAVFSHGKIDVTEAALAFVMELYVVFSFSCIILLRDIEFGQYIYLLIFLSAWMTDTGAYFVGRFFGKHKLIEDVSPKKTIEGAVGGVIICVLSFVVFGIIIGAVSDAVPNYIGLIIVGAVTSVISQCGDLIASLIKRKYSIKDYGWVFPGHGGVMDRFDSIIATAPFLYILTSASDLFSLFI